jgi:hypothetical protein
MDLFGMESYLINMYEQPDLVHAVTDRGASSITRPTSAFSPRRATW